MDGYFFSAADDDRARGAKDMTGGPIPGNGEFPSIPDYRVIPSPHLWELTALANKVDYVDHTREVREIWPVFAPGEVPTGPIGEGVMGLPDSLRDDLAALAPTPDLAQDWSKSVFGMTPDDAGQFIESIARLARHAKAEGHHLYAWWTL